MLHLLALVIFVGCCCPTLPLALAKGDVQYIYLVSFSLPWLYLGCIYSHTCTCIGYLLGCPCQTLPLALAKGDVQ